MNIWEIQQEPRLKYRGYYNNCSRKQDEAEPCDKECEALSDEKYCGFEAVLKPTIGRSGFAGYGDGNLNCGLFLGF